MCQSLTRTCKRLVSCRFRCRSLANHVLSTHIQSAASRQGVATHCVGVQHAWLHSSSSMATLEVHTCWSLQLTGIQRSRLQPGWPHAGPARRGSTRTAGKEQRCWRHAGHHLPAHLYAGMEAEQARPGRKLPGPGGSVHSQLLAAQLLCSTPQRSPAPGAPDSPGRRQVPHEHCVRGAPLPGCHQVPELLCSSPPPVSRLCTSLGMLLSMWQARC